MGLSGSQSVASAKARLGRCNSCLDTTHEVTGRVTLIHHGDLRLVMVLVFCLGLGGVLIRRELLEADDHRRNEIIYPLVRLLMLLVIN